MKKILVFIFILGVLISKSKTVFAADLRLINEINDISINEHDQTLVIKGWALIADAQNFYNDKTHQYILTLKSKSDEISINGSLRAMSHTDTMLLVGKRYCNDHEFGLSVEVCNNYYENIGFEFKVPLSKLKMEEDYVATLTTKALQSGVSRSTEVYFPNKNTITLSHGKNNYIIDSKLHNMSVKVLDSFIYVRNKPGKTGTIYQSKSSCSNNKNLYYDKGSTFNKVFDKAFLNNTTYYQLSGDESGCKDNRMRVKAGNSIKPMWIASNFIEHLGEALTIKTRVTDNAPSITVSDHPTLYVGEEVDIFKGVSAQSKDGTDLTERIRMVEHNLEDKVGVYTIKYSVKDDYNDVAYGYKTVTIISRNHPPVIVAEDIEITQFDPYNPYDYADAFDQDNNNINDKLESTTTIDTSKVGTFDQCYKVIDKYGLETRKCVKVTIKKAETNLRFIQHKRLFYLENTPSLWKDKTHKLEIELNNDIIYDNITLSK